MCRIAGIIDSQQSSEGLLPAVQAMCDRMQHGGPDDQGICAAGGDVVFGHRRLALLDLSAAGHQPMHYEQLCIVFNGEIYNYLELKAELVAAGCRFNTATDTEVLLAGFSVWGTALFERLEGMFAFALYDEAAGLTYLVRDQAAIKPLYYYAEGAQLVFASEVKAFRASGLSFEENPDWKVYFLSFGHLPHPFTTLKAVYSLAGGHYLRWEHATATWEIRSFAGGERGGAGKDERAGADKAGSAGMESEHAARAAGEVASEKRESARSAGTAATAAAITNASEAEQSLKTSLEQAVQKHLIADAPIGVFLSGGIDSSLLTLLANQVVHERLNTLSINFAETAFSEEKYQRLVADKTGGTHRSYRIEQEDLNRHFHTIMTAMDQPSNDAINSWFVNRCAKENGLKAVLSGIGADELLGGYPSFGRMGLIKRLKRLPRFVLRMAARLPSDKLKRIYFLSYRNPVGEYLFLRGFFTPSAVARLTGRPIAGIHQLLEDFPIDRAVYTLQGKERASWMETELFMKNQLLKDTDYMSMAHGMEVRVPFLDQHFRETLKAISPSLKFDSAQPKGLLVNSFRQLLPEAVWKRPKMGFTFPLQEWFRQHPTVTNTKYYSSNPFALKQINRFKAGKLHWSKAFALYQVFAPTKPATGKPEIKKPTTGKPESGES